MNGEAKNKHVCEGKERELSETNSGNEMKKLVEYFEK